jgi:hypothetical protein
MRKVVVEEVELGRQRYRSNALYPKEANGSVVAILIWL